MGQTVALDHYIGVVDELLERFDKVNEVRGERAKRASRSNTRRGNPTIYPNRTLCDRQASLFV